MVQPLRVPLLFCRGETGCDSFSEDKRPDRIVFSIFMRVDPSWSVVIFMLIEKIARERPECVFLPRLDVELGSVHTVNLAHVGKSLNPEYT